MPLSVSVRESVVESLIVSDFPSHCRECLGEGEGGCLEGVWGCLEGVWQGWAGMTFWHLGTGMGMAQPIPKLWEREREWKIAFPTFGNGNGNENSIPNFWEREWKFHSRISGSGMRRCYSREWLGTGTGWHRKIKWTFFVILLLYHFAL